MIVFLHGLESSGPTSRTGKLLKDSFKDETVKVVNYNTHASYEEVEAELTKQFAKFPRMTLVGISFGGYWAYKMASMFPHKIEDCILLNPSLNYYKDELKRIEDTKDFNLSLIVNEDDDVVSPANALKLLKGRARIIKYKTGGHRFDNKEELIAGLHKVTNTIWL